MVPKVRPEVLMQFLVSVLRNVIRTNNESEPIIMRRARAYGSFC